MRALILAQGAGTRWDDYLGGPKQLVVKVDGETVLARTVRLLLERGVSDIVIVGPDERFHVPGAALVILDDPTISTCDMDKFLGTRHLWAAEDRTVLLWGDVFYTADAMNTIVRHDDDALHYFRRPGRSAVTGHRWDESFAVSFGAHEHHRVLALAEHVASLWRRRRLKSTHIRTHYAASLGLPDRELDSVRALVDTPGQTIIDDFTEDFDRPDEWRAWMGRWHAGHYKAAVLSPWRAGCEWRELSAGLTARHWADLGVPVFYGDSDGQPMNRSAARNAAAARALEAIPDLDVLFFADADTWVPADQFWASCHLAVTTGRLIRAYHQWHKLSRSFTQSVANGRAPRRPNIERTAYNHASAALALTPTLWRTLGGYDERFVGWGAEDRAFWLAAQTVAGWGDHVDGSAWHLWHPHAPDRHRSCPTYDANVALGMRYKAAAGVTDQAGILPVAFTPITDADPDELARILAEPGGPHDPALESCGRPAVAPAVADRPAPSLTYTAPSPRPRVRPTARRPVRLPAGRATDGR